MNEPKIIINPHFYPAKNKWSVLVVDMNNSGTHHNYHVIENSACDNKFYDSEEQAIIAGQTEEILYRSTHEMPE